MDVRRDCVEIRDARAGERKESAEAVAVRVDLAREALVWASRADAVLERGEEVVCTSGSAMRLRAE
jgi:hypothetical protein